MKNQKRTAISRLGQCRRILSQRFRPPVAILLLLTSAALAQLTTADILGTVTDQTGASVPNASVTLTNLGTNDQRTVQSNGSGDYTFTLIPVGHYSISVKAGGFQESITKDLGVEAGDRARADVHLQVGSQTAVVEVTATTPLLQADSATVRSTLTAKAVQDLPLNGRNFVQLVQIVPGANEGPGNGLTSGGCPDDRRQTASFSVNGQDDTLNNYTIDGIDDNERIIGTIGVRPIVEAIDEITVPQPTGEVGNTPRNSLFGPDFRHVDLSLFKNFAVTERVNLQFRAEAYNITNTPSFIFPLGDGSTELGSTNFGVVSNFDPNYAPRLYQFALKAQF